MDSTDTEWPAEFQPLALWPDNSIQWLQIRTQVRLAAGDAARLHVRQRRAVTDSTNTEIAPARTSVVDLGDELAMFCRERTFRIPTRQLGLPACPDEQLTGQIEVSAGGQLLEVPAAKYAYRTVLGATGPLGFELTGEGHCTLPDDRRLRCSLQLFIDAAGERLEGTITLHNPAAAVHPGGLWDLGDPNSVELDSVNLRLSSGAPAKGGRVRCQRNQDPIAFSYQADVAQTSSGGEYWDSPVHVDHTGSVPFKERGYSCAIDGITTPGLRADPVVELTSGAVSLAAYIPAFWERFPSRLAASSDCVTFGLMPLSDSKHELQPGERWSRDFCLHLSRTGAGEITGERFPELEWTFDPDYVASCGLPGIGDPADVDPRLLSLIREGVDGDANFFAKREAIDEYGWRHFGDLYADHETDGATDAGLFVSHYNNQYDALLGFQRLYLWSGDARWFELAHDLARHTVDIDMYHTENDRPEYNHGLFWHTDHYLPAGTATHRAYSRLQPANAYQDHARGGGPGGQHCYTGGLLQHYLLTGSQQTLDALYGLRSWIENVYEGAGTLTDVLLAVRNRRRADLKNHLTGQYPLDRGIANYIHALLDCHALDQRASSLAQVEWVIQHTVHPADAIEDRHLDQVEETWFYTVLLQAICRYLDVKAEHDAFDAAFFYARDALLHYADWMLANEAPYLDKPDILEFPNHTWSAQDLRKANILYYAAYWTPETSGPYTTKAQEFVDYVVSALENEPTRHYTRILVLLMQNARPSRPLTPTHGLRRPRGRYDRPCAPDPIRQALNLTRLALRALRRLRIRSELSAIRRLLTARHGNLE